MRWKRLNLIQKFSLLSLLVIGLIALFLGYASSYFLTKDFLCWEGVKLEGKDINKKMRLQV